MGQVDIDDKLLIRDLHHHIGCQRSAKVWLKLWLKVEAAKQFVRNQFMQCRVNLVLIADGDSLEESLMLILGNVDKACFEKVPYFAGGPPSIVSDPLSPTAQPWVFLHGAEEHRNKPTAIELSASSG